MRTTVGLRSLPILHFTRAQRAQNFAERAEEAAPMEPPAAAEPSGGENDADQDDLDGADYEPGADAGVEEDDDAAAAAAAAAAAEGLDGEAGEEGKKKRRGRKKDASDLNLLEDPQDVVVELTADVLEELSGHKKLHQLRYPTFIVVTHPNFQLRSIEGLQAVKGTALKELDLSNNRLLVLDGLEQFSTLKVLRAAHNEIAEVTIEKLPRLKHLDLSYNKLDGIPDLSGFKALAHLDLSHNRIGTRPDSETSRDGWENFKHAPLQQLTTLKLNDNALAWDQKAFNEQVAMLKEKKLKHISLENNPFVDEVEAYRIWLISNCIKLVSLDGDKVSPVEKRSRIKEPPAVVRDGAVAEKDDVYLGKKVTVKIFEQTAKLMRCFDRPEQCLDVVQAVQEDLLRLVPIDPRGRIMFDIEVEDARNELELMEDADADETTEVKSEHGEDFREPPELIEEFMQTLVLLIERQPAASAKVLRLMVLCLSFENEGLSTRALEQLLDFLEAGGSYSELVVSTLMSTLIPQLTDAKIPEHSRDLLLRALHMLAEEGEGVKEGMRPLAPTLAQWLGHASPSEAVLGVIASACRDTKTVLELREERLAKRVITLIQACAAYAWRVHGTRLVCAVCMHGLCVCACLVKHGTCRVQRSL